MKHLKLILLLAGAMVLSACGSDSDSDPGPVGSSATNQSAGNDSAGPDNGAGEEGGSTTMEFPLPSNPLLVLDPLGPISDVTANWQDYQPAASFCVPLNAPELTPGGSGPTVDGTDPACAFSGFGPDDEGLFKVEVPVPLLCPGCRRIFINYAEIPEDKPGQLLFHTHGHAYYQIRALNLGYTIDPIAHSPNTKNFTNDKLVAPADMILEMLIGAVDTYLATYVTDTAKFANTAIQGPYYIGPWYVNQNGERINGIYLDVDVTSVGSLGHPEIDAIRYFAAFNSGQITCIGNGLPGGILDDANLLYGGCLDRFGVSRDSIDPFATPEQEAP